MKRIGGLMNIFVNQKAYNKSQNERLRLGRVSNVPVLKALYVLNMSISELKNKLSSLGVNQNSYSLSGGLPNEKYCFTNESGKWFVYYSERGQRTGESIFTHEKEECEFLLGTLTNDQTSRV